MKWRRGAFFWTSLSIFLMVALPLALGEEKLLEMYITKCPRPNIVVAEVKTEGKIERVRVKLAGLRVPLENLEIYRQALLRLRELVEGKSVGFDFALGFTPKQRPWVGYLYVEQGDGEPCIVNAVLLCEGLAVLDAKTAGRNLLGYLLDMQEKAQKEGLGVWKETPKKGERKEEECPSCVIRFPAALAQGVPQEFPSERGGQE